MKNDSANITNKEKKTILSVTPLPEDHTALRKVLHRSSRSDEHWKLLTTSSVDWATKLLRRYTIPIAVCERDLRPSGTWTDLLEQMTLMPHSPLVIVTSRFADERLWAEVLNLGGWDVLSKPFNHTEVMRVIESAWQRWKNCQEVPAGAPQFASGWA